MRDTPERTAVAARLRTLYDELGTTMRMVQDDELVGPRRLERFVGSLLRARNEVSRALHVLRADGAGL
jgi:hypothetical protein